MRLGQFGPTHGSLVVAAKIAILLRSDHTVLVYLQSKGHIIEEEAVIVEFIYFIANYIVGSVLSNYLLLAIHCHYVLFSVDLFIINPIMQGTMVESVDI